MFSTDFIFLVETLVFTDYHVLYVQFFQEKAKSSDYYDKKDPVWQHWILNWRRLRKRLVAMLLQQNTAMHQSSKWMSCYAFAKSRSFTNTNPITLNAEWSYKKEKEKKNTFPFKQRILCIRNALFTCYALWWHVLKNILGLNIFAKRSQNDKRRVVAWWGCAFYSLTRFKSSVLQ